MAVYSSEAKAGPFISDGSQREFPYQFRVLDRSHVQVYINGALVDSGYTVNEYSVVLDEAPPAGANVVLLRKVPLTQEVDIQNNTAFYPEVLEGAYDKLTMITQQLAEQVERSIKVGVGETDASPDALLNSIYASGTAAAKAGEAAVKASAEAVEAGEAAVKASAEAVEAARNVKETADEIAEYLDKNAGLPVGFTFASPSAEPPEGAYLLNGQTIACGEELYRKFYEWVTTSPVRRITADEYEAEIAEYGICGAFVVSGSSVRLPRWNGYQTPLGDSVPVRGNGMTLGFSNGTQNTGLNFGTNNILQSSTVAYGLPVGSTTSTGASYSMVTAGVATDPEKSGIIADTSGYSQDDFHWCIQVYNAATALSEQESAQLASEVQLKAQTDLGNVTNPTQGFKDMAIDWGMPDYSAGVDITSNFATGGSSYTVPCDCCIAGVGADDYSVLLYTQSGCDYTNRDSWKYALLFADGHSGDNIFNTDKAYCQKGMTLYNDVSGPVLGKVIMYPLKGANK